MSNTPSDSHARISTVEKVAYGSGDSASNFFFHTFNIFLLSYYVDVFGLTAAAVGTMFLVTKLVDAFTDIIMGMVADRTKTRWGRFRPWILWMAIPYGIIGYSMFANPDLSSNGKLIYAYLTYSLMMLVYTAINVPYSSLLGVISPHSSERTSLSTYRFVMAFLAQLLISAFVIPLKNMLGGENEALGYQLTMAIFAFLSIALWMFTFASTRERVPVSPTQSKDLKGDLKVLLHNGPWLALVVCGLFTLMMVAVRGGATLFYMKYYAQVDTEPVFWIFDKTSIFFMGGTASMVVGAAFTKLLTRFFSKKSLMLGLFALHGLMLGLFFFIPPEMYWTMLIVNTIATLINGPTPAIVWSMYADVADYGEWKFHRRTTGLVFSGVIFSHKTGLAIGAGLSGWILSWFGFIANQPQSDMAIFGIRFMFTIVPFLLLMIATAAILFYKINTPLLRQIEADLEARRSNSPTGA